MTGASEMPGRTAARIGIDLGGTKIEGLLLGADGIERKRHRIAAPRGDYAATIAAIRDLAGLLDAVADGPATVGIGMPGSLSPATGLVQNSNSTWLNGRRLDADLSAALGRPLRFANDANCFALSEAVDGAGAGAHTVFGVILGTGCGGGIVIGGRIVNGPRGIGGEWGHNPLPWASARGASGTALLVRTARMYGDVGVGNWAAAGSRAGHGRSADRGGDRVACNRRRPGVKGDARRVMRRAWRAGSRIS